MNNRTITASVVASIAIIAVWWLFLFSPARSDASKVGDELTTAKAQTRTLEVQKKQIDDLEKRAPQINAERDKLRAAVPQDADLASFIDQANELGTEAGITWVSVSPTEPTAGGVAGEIPLNMQVTGGYFQVLDYLNKLENMPRLVIVDQVALTATASAEGASAAAPQLSATLTARMFSQGGAAATVAPDGSTTPTSVAGGGGVAAPQGTES